MNLLDQEIAAHLQWKTKLRAYFEDRSININAAYVEEDDHCELGKWLHRQGMVFKSNAAFIQLQAKHAEFHKCAAGLLRARDSGQELNADEVLGAGSEFGRLSDEVVALLLALKETTGTFWGRQRKG